MGDAYSIMPKSIPKKKVLFLCTGNSCRSQMAEGLLRWLAGDHYEVYSAGVAPSRVHPMAILVMQELGIDISGQSSDLVDDYLDEGIEIVITVCDHARQSCPVFPGQVERIHWSIVDPFHGWTVEERMIPRYRATRDELRQRIEKFIEDQKLEAPRRAKLGQLK